MKSAQRALLVSLRAPRCDFSGSSSKLELAHIISASAMGTRCFTYTRYNYVLLQGHAYSKGTSHHLFDTSYKPLLRDFWLQHLQLFPLWLSGKVKGITPLPLSHENVLQRHFKISYQWAISNKIRNRRNGFLIDDSVSFLHSLV